MSPRRTGFAAVLFCALQGLAVGSALAQSGQAPAPEKSPDSPAEAPAGPIAPIAPAAPAPQTKPVPALQPTAPAATDATPAPTAPTANAPTAVPPAQQEEPKEEPPPPEPAEPPATPEPPTTSAGAASTIATDAEITLDEPTSEASDDDDEKLRWMASIDWGQSFNAAGISRGGEQSYNPEYIWDFTAAVGYRLDKVTTIMLRQPLTLELTDSEVTNSRQELWLLDTTLDATRKFIKHEATPDDTFSLLGGLGLVFPVSPTSQAAHLILGTRAKVGFDYDREGVLHGLGAGIGFAYLRRWASSNQVHADEATPCILGSDDIAQSCTHQGGASTTRDVLKLDVHGELRPLAQLAINASFALGWNRAHGLKDDDYELPSTGYRVALPDDETHWRNTRELMLGVSYDFTDWFSASASVTNGFREIVNGEVRGPFNVVDTAFGLTLSLSIDQLYLAQSGRGTAPRGRETGGH